MALIRWEPARELQSFQQEMNRLFGTFFDAQGGTAGPGAPASRWIPAMDLVEEKDSFVLHADLPGVAEKDVKVELEENVLSISGERVSEHRDRHEGFYRVERASGSFQRSLTLPEGIDPEAIDAHFENGVLTVRIPKPEQRKPRRVAISVGAGEPAIEGHAAPQGAKPAEAPAEAAKAPAEPALA
jgi:HSP20 family protein